jgi:transglutaminase-like putative cysteine protease
MSIHVALNHVTHYRYDRRSRCRRPQVVRLRPAPHCRSNILSYSLQGRAGGHFINWQQDPFANYLARLVFPEKTTEFKVTVDLVAEMAVYNPFDFFLEPEAEKFPFTYDARAAQSWRPTWPSPATPLLRCRPSPGQHRPHQAHVDFLVGLNQRCSKTSSYLIRMEPGVQTPEETLTQGSGSCRDSAGCWCSCCATWAWRRASSRAT